MGVELAADGVEMVIKSFEIFLCGNVCKRSVVLGGMKELIFEHRGIVL